MEKTALVRSSWKSFVRLTVLLLTGVWLLHAQLNATERS